MRDATGALCQMRGELDPFLLGCLGGRRMMSTRKLADYGIEGAADMMRGAEEAQCGMRLALKFLLQIQGKARLSDPRLATNQHHAAFATARLGPAPVEHA